MGLFSSISDIAEFERDKRHYALVEALQQQQKSIEIISLMKAAGVKRLVVNPEISLERGEVLVSRFDENGHQVFELEQGEKESET